jgi:hypothetical protein
MQTSDLLLPSSLVSLLISLNPNPSPCISCLVLQGSGLFSWRSDFSYPSAERVLPT